MLDTHQIGGGHLPLVGTDADLVRWFSEDWRNSGLKACILAGFSGVGKTRLSQELVQSWGGSAVLVTAAEGVLGIEDVLLEIAARLESIGETSMSDEADLNLVAGLRDAMHRGSLIVIDDFQSIADPATRLPPPEILKLVQQLNAVPCTGRLLLVSDEAPPDGLWLEQFELRHLLPPQGEAAVRILEGLLQDRGLSDEVPVSRRRDVVNWLGGNPRAMRALVACLEGESLQSLIEAEPEAWDLRDQLVSPQLVQRLESHFVERTLDRLGAAPLLLAELLSVYRKPFQADAIERTARQVGDVAACREVLAARFLLAGNRGWYSLHPVIRHLGRARVGKDPKRDRLAHDLAADHYSRHFRGGRVPTRITSAGDSFVEARFHLLTADRNSEFEDISSAFREQLLKTYGAVRKTPVDEGQAKQLLAILGAALVHDDRGYAALRALLARLLLRRRQAGDDRLALRQLVFASRESRDPWVWQQRIRLTAEIDGLASARSAADQALAVLRPPTVGGVYATLAPLLATAGQLHEAVAWLNAGLEVVPEDSVSALYTMGAFLLTQQRRESEALDLLVSGYRRLGPQNGKSWRLLEEAGFIAFGRSDVGQLAALRHEASAVGDIKGLQSLFDVLLLQLRGLYREAATKSEQHADHPACCTQAVFCWLCAGEVERAAGLLSSASLPNNSAVTWLRAVVALCRGEEELYAEELERLTADVRDPSRLRDPQYWLELWGDVPTGLAPFPAFYFPRLPSGLTQLSVDLTPAMLDEVEVSAIRLPMAGVGVTPRETRAEGGRSTTPTSVVINVEGGRAMSQQGDHFTISGGQNSAVGSRAISTGNSFQQLTVAGESVNLESLATELDALRKAMRRMAEEPAEDMSVAEIGQAAEAARDGDEGRVIQHLRSAGRWALDAASTVGTSLAEAALKSALGM